MDEIVIREATERLRAIGALPDNWNGNGAHAFSQAHIAEATRFFNALPYEPEVFPTANDSVQFEYEKETGEYLEFEVFADGRVKAFRVDDKMKESTTFFDMMSGMNGIITIIEGFHAGTV